MILVSVVALRLVPFSSLAEASAWNQKAGQGLIITDFTFSGGTHYFNDLGHLAPATLYDKHEFSGYMEYGLTDDFMLLLKPVLMSTAVGAPTTARYSGLGTSEGGVQWHVASLGPTLLSVQGSLRRPGITSEGNPALIGNTSHDVDARALLGTAFKLGSWPVFIDAQMGFRFRSGGAPGEWHTDLTFGARPRPWFLILVQSFNTVAQGPGTAWFPASSYSKLGLSVVYDMTRAWSVQFGVVSSIGGIDALRERGVQAGLWYRF